MFHSTRSLTLLLAIQINKIFLIIDLSPKLLFYFCTNWNHLKKINKWYVAIAFEISYSINNIYIIPLKLKQNICKKFIL